MKFLDWFLGGGIYFDPDDAGGAGGDDDKGGGGDTGDGGAGDNDRGGDDKGGTGTPSLVDPKGEDKADDGKEGGKGEPGTSAGAPEKYDTFKLPDGVELDDASLGKITDLFREAGMSQEMAQKFVDYRIAEQQEQLDAHVATVKEWRDALINDPDIGGDKLEPALVRGHALLNTFDDGSVAELFKDTGLGTHPGLTKLFNRIALAVGEDALRGGSPTSDKSTLSQYERNKRDFPNSPEMWGPENAA